MSKKILILGAGLEQSIAIKEAKRLNYFVIACDANPNAFGFQFSDISYVIDINNVDEIYLIGLNHKIHGIFTHAVEIPHVVSKVAEKLKLPCLSFEKADRATNKSKRIEHLTKCNIPCAKYVHVKNENNLLEFASKIGFPLIIKPIDNAGSRGVRLVENEADLKIAFNEAVKYSKVKEVLLEEVLSGPEISTESIVHNGKIHTFAFADRNYNKKELFKPFFIEDGINFPSSISEELKTEVLDLVEKTIKCLEIDFGAAKGDIIIDNGIPKIIEMAARTSGGWFGAGSMLFATGANMLEPLIQMAVGDEPNMKSFEINKNLGCAQRYIIPQSDGIVESIEGIDNIEKMPGVEMSVLFLPEIGQKISKATNHAERFGQIICTAQTREEAIRLCENVIKQVKINIK
jgi:biotin carboxylase